MEGHGEIQPEPEAKGLKGIVMDSIKGTTLHRLISSVAPQGPFAAQPPVQAPRDVVELAPAQTPAPTAPSQAPAPPHAASIFTSFAPPTAATTAPEAAVAQAPVNNPTVLTMEEPTAPAAAPEAPKTPMQQASELSTVIMQTITALGQSGRMASSQEVRQRFGTLNNAAAQLESLSKRLESQGQAKSEENQYIEFLQADLAQAMQSFQQILSGAVNAETGMAMYTANTRAQVNMEMAQFATQNNQVRQGIISQYTASVGPNPGGIGAPGMGMPGPLGAPAFGTPGPMGGPMGAPAYGAPGYGAPGMGGAPGYGGMGTPGAYPNSTYATNGMPGPNNTAAGYATAPGASPYLSSGVQSYPYNRYR